ncbi:hypothetical protein FLJC2902T_26870 [Flavobacterium limnosediminis JC2902]|uniref:Uncharacterized protein n=1 Tax=Flavobacterium limnosediminis JC2902 TaxID=1341181 RepID=V6SIZ1_9FLAO|nr:hypothetical protein FLJC2902T_26870 [Flavobacterium limnosediminis JC2902]
MLRQVIVGPDAVMSTAGFTTILLENTLLPHSFVNVNV